MIGTTKKIKFREKKYSLPLKMIYFWPISFGLLQGVSELTTWGALLSGQKENINC